MKLFGRKPPEPPQPSPVDDVWDPPPTPDVVYSTQRHTVYETTDRFAPPMLPSAGYSQDMKVRYEYTPWELVASHAVQLYDSRNENRPSVTLVVVWRTRKVAVLP